MAVHLLVLCVFCQAIINTSLGASLPLTYLDTAAVSIEPLSSPPAGKPLRSSPKVPSRANDILTEYLKFRDSITELPLPASTALSSLSKVSSRAGDILLEYFKSQPTSSSTETTQLSSPKAPDVFLDYFKTQCTTTDWSLDFKTPPKIGPRHSSTQPACSVSVYPPAKSYDTKTFSTVSYPPSLPVVDVYKISASKPYQSNYPPISTLPSLNYFSSTSVTSLPTISSDALKRNVNSLNQGSKFASHLYFSNICPIPEYKTSLESFTSANFQYALPYPLQYKLQSLPKVVTPPVNNYLNLSCPKFATNQQLYNQKPLPKLKSTVFNDKTKLIYSKTAPKIPFSTNTYLSSCINNSDQTITADSINPLRDQIVFSPVEPYPINNLEILSQKTRPTVSNNVIIKPIDEFCCKLNHKNRDGVTNTNFNPNLPKISNSLPIYSDSGIENRITEMVPILSSVDVSTPNTAEIPIPNVTTCTQSIANIVPDVSSSAILCVPPYTQMVPSNYLNVSPSLSLSTTSSSSVSAILSHIIYAYLPYLISSRRKPRKSAKVFPINPYSNPKPIQSSSTTTSLNPRLSLPMFSQAPKNQMVYSLVAPTIMSSGPSTLNSQSIDMTSLYYDFCSPSFITYSPDITAPTSQVTPLVPLTVTWLPPGTFVNYSPSQLGSHSLPLSVAPWNFEFSSPSTIVEPAPIMHVKYSDKSKSIERLLEFVCLAELIKGKSSVDWNAIEMALALLSTI